MRLANSRCSSRYEKRSLQKAAAAKTVLQEPRHEMARTVSNQHAAGAVLLTARIYHTQRWDRGDAIFAAPRASRLKRAAWRERRQLRDTAGNRLELATFKGRRSCQQSFGIGMPRLREHFAHWPL